MIKLKKEKLEHPTIKQRKKYCQNKANYRDLPVER